jgi:hypothetical protein
MPSDLLYHLSGPTAYSSWWLVIAAALVVAVIGWYAGVVVWTLPPRRLARIPLIRAVHARLIRRGFARSIRVAGQRHRAGGLSSAQAAAVMSRTLRSFLALRAGGSGARYMHVGDIAAGDLAPAAPVLSALNDARFNHRSQVDLTRIERDAEEVIRSWS